MTELQGDQGIDSGAPGGASGAGKHMKDGRGQVVDTTTVQNGRAARLAQAKAKLPKRCFDSLMATPTRYLDKRLKAHLGEASPRRAIEAKCEECVGYENVRENVGACTSFTCPLHKYRPFQGANK